MRMSVKKQGNGAKRLRFYMDLVSHDMLNDNQAVMSYLELILAMPSLDKKASDYARKAVAHIRSSTMRVENVKNIVAIAEGPFEPGPADLTEAIETSSEELGRMFPGRKISVDKAPFAGRPMVAGGAMVKEVLLTVMASVVKLDQGSQVDLRVKVEEESGYGNRGWTVSIEDPNVKLPAMVKDTDIDSLHTKDSSLASKTSGFLFSKMAAEALGGDFDVIPRGSGPAGKGAVFELRLRRAGTA